MYRFFTDCKHAKPEQTQLNLQMETFDSWCSIQKYQIDISSCTIIKTIHIISI